MHVKEKKLQKEKLQDLKSLRIRNSYSLARKYRMSDLYLLEQFIKEALLDEAKKKRKTKYPKQYKAKGKRKKTLDKATKLAKSDNPSDRAKAYRMRDNQEKKERKKKSWKNVPRHDTKKS
jgi:hypothetical protein